MKIEIFPESVSAYLIQKQNAEIYGRVNGRNFEVANFVTRLHRFIARINRAIRHKKTERISYHFSMAVSWICAIANRLHIDLDASISNTCESPCGQSIADLQKLFSKKHEGVSILEAALCVSEKVMGIGCALEYFRTTHEPANLSEAARRMAQSIEALLVLGELMEIEIAGCYVLYFKDGCPVCRRNPCNCSFRTDKVL